MILQNGTQIKQMQRIYSDLKIWTIKKKKSEKIRKNPSNPCAIEQLKHGFPSAKMVKRRPHL